MQHFFLFPFFFISHLFHLLTFFSLAQTLSLSLSLSLYIYIYIYAFSLFNLALISCISSLYICKDKSSRTFFFCGMIMAISSPRLISILYHGFSVWPKLFGLASLHHFHNSFRRLNHPLFFADDVLFSNCEMHRIEMNIVTSPIPG